MKRLISYSETPQVTGLEYKELFSYRKEKVVQSEHLLNLLLNIVP